MNEPIDHAAEAREFLARARAGQNNILAELGDDDSELDAEDLMLAQEGVSAAASQANAHATLALVAAQDRANELKRIEILVMVCYGPTILDENRSATVAESEAWQALHDQTGQQDPLAPSIARSLGLGGESDEE